MIVLTGQVDGEQVPRPPAVVWAAWFGIGTSDVTAAHIRYCRPVQYVSTKTLVRWETYIRIGNTVHNDYMYVDFVWKFSFFVINITCKESGRIKYEVYKWRNQLLETWYIIYLC